MATSKSIDDLLAEVGREVAYVTKGGKNEAQSYSYARAEDVLKKVNEALFSRGVSVSSDAELVYFNVTPYEKENQYGKRQMFRTDAAVHLRLTFHFGDEERTVEAVGSATDTADKAVFKANTGALKYVLANAFLISWGDDPEADEAVDAEAGANRKPKGRKKSGGTSNPRKKAATAESTDNNKPVEEVW